MLEGTSFGLANQLSMTVSESGTLGSLACASLQQHRRTVADMRKRFFAGTLEVFPAQSCRVSNRDKFSFIFAGSRYAKTPDRGVDGRCGKSGNVHGNARTFSF